MRREVQTHYGPDQALVCPAIGTSHGAGHMDVPDVALVYGDEVSQAPVFRCWMHPGVLELISHPEHGIGDAKVVFCIFPEEKQTIVVGLTHSIFPKYSLPAGMVSSHPCTEVSHDHTLVGIGGRADSLVELHVRTTPLRHFGLSGWARRH